MKDGGVEDDIPVGLARPRDEAVRALPEAVEIIRTIIHHLGLESAATDEPAPMQRGVDEP